MLVYLYRFLCGYLTIKIFGDFPERFINICAFNHIQLWNIRRKKDSIYANLSVSDYLKIRRVKKNRSIHIRLIRKKGIYFTLRPYFKRKGIAVGIVVFFLVLVFLSQFIWNIEVVGNKTLGRNEILNFCKEIGIKEGTPTALIDTNSARLKLLMNNEELSWASFIVEGSHLTVNISETKKVDKKDESPNNLIAFKDGVVEKVIVSGGKAVVIKNQAVLKGDMLVSGAIEYANGITNFVRCEGKVLARTECDKVCETPLTVTKTYETGKIAKRRVLTFFGLKIPLSGVPIEFKHTKEICTETISNGGSYSPISISTVVYKEECNKQVKMSVKEAQEYLLKVIKKEEETDMKDVEILSYNDKFSVINNKVKLKRNYKCIENIATAEKIKIINVN